MYFFSPAYFAGFFILIYIDYIFLESDQWLQFPIKWPNVNDHYTHIKSEVNITDFEEVIKWKFGEF